MYERISKDPKSNFSESGPKFENLEGHAELHRDNLNTVVDSNTSDIVADRHFFDRLRCSDKSCAKDIKVKNAIYSSKSHHHSKIDNRTCHTSHSFIKLVFHCVRVSVSHVNTDIYQGFYRLLLNIIAFELGKECQNKLPPGIQMCVCVILSCYFNTQRSTNLNESFGRLSDVVNRFGNEEGLEILWKMSSEKGKIRLLLICIVYRLEFSHWFFLSYITGRPSIM